MRRQPNLLVVVDIDGTIADARNRYLLAGVEPSRNDKIEYTKWVNAVQSHESLMSDVDVPGMGTFVAALATDDFVDVVYVTARNEEFRDTTRTWLEDMGFPTLPLHMRGINDWRSSGDYKESVIQNLVAKSGKYTAVIVVDDDPAGDVQAVAQKNGWTFLKAIGYGYL